jgi:glucose dehydrogenase
MQILTQRNDPGRTGVNHGETFLNPGNVNVNSFGRLASAQLNQGGIYAQPLYVSQVNFGPQGVHDTVFVATMNNFVFAVDANTGAILKQQKIDGKQPVPSKKYFGQDYNDIVGKAPNIGILLSLA